MGISVRESNELKASIQAAEGNRQQKEGMNQMPSQDAFVQRGP